MELDQKLIEEIKNNPTAVGILRKEYGWMLRGPDLAVTCVPLPCMHEPLSADEVSEEVIGAYNLLVKAGLMTYAPVLNRFSQKYPDLQILISNILEVEKEYET